MHDIIQAINHWSEVWLGMMWAVLWQSTLLVGVVALVARMLRHSSPAVRYWLWQIVAIKLLLMPFWSHAVPIPWPTGPFGSHYASVPAASAADDSGAAIAKPRPEPHVLTAGESSAAVEPARGAFQQVGWPSWLLLAWSAEMTYQLVRLAAQRIRLGGLLRRAFPVDAELTAVVGRLAGQVGLRWPPAVVWADPDCPLFVCGLRRPILVLPAGLSTSLAPDELRQVLLHELAHIKRHDLLWCWPAEIARMLYFFHPAVHWVCFRLRLERELACDQQAMALGGRSPTGYAEALLRVISIAAEPRALRTATIAAGFYGHPTGFGREEAPSEKS